MNDASHRLTAALADRYRIERELGQGGMATVYLAEDLKHRRRVAIKVLRPELSAVIGAERFLREIQTIAALQHPHILGLIDSGEVQGTAYYVMPFVEGESLRDRLTREKQLSISEGVRIAIEVAGALDYAHRHGVIHRDIKPENILLHDGSALVADFGIALAVSTAGGTRMTETGMSLGTPHYMSPEQAMGEREITARSDLYALGCVTYEMLLGEPPFTGPTAQAIVAKMMTEEPRSLVLQRKTIPLPVNDAVLTALEKLPADRWETAGAFAAALAGGGPVSGRTRGHQVGPSRRHRAIPVPVFLAGLVLAVLAVAFATYWGHGPGTESVYRVPLALPASEALRVSRAPGVAVPPDGSGILYVGPGLGTRTQLWFRPWHRLHGDRLTRSLDEACCLAFSPSGDTIAYLSAPRSLNLLPLTGGLPSALPDSALLSVTDWVGGLAWSDDGWLYAAGLSGLIRINPRTGAEELVAPYDSARGDAAFLWPQVLPGGRRAIVTVVGGASPTDPEGAAIGLADFESGKVSILLQGLRALFIPAGYLVVVRPNGVLAAVAFNPGTGRMTGALKELNDTVAVRGGSAAPGMTDLVLDANGNLVYVAGGTESFQPVWVNRTGAWEPVAGGLRAPQMEGAALSPDARRMVITASGEDRNRHLWIQPLTGGARTRLTFEGVNMRARWRPKTDRISFQASLPEEGRARFRLFELSASGAGDVRPLLVADPRGIGSHAWSPDGRWLLYRTDDQDPGNGDIMVVRSGLDSVPRPLVATAAEELGPAVSPDGRWLAYSSNESGRREVYVRPFPDTEAGRYQVSFQGGMTPVWSRNGRELFFVDAGQHLVVVPVESGPGFRVGPARVLFSTAGYFLQPYHPQIDVTTDGERFLMIRSESGDDLELVVVTGFLAELESRMRER